MRNLNIRGNPISDNEKSAKKVKPPFCTPLSVVISVTAWGNQIRTRIYVLTLQVRKLLLPSVNVFNAKPLDKSTKNEKHARFDTNDESFDARHNKSAEEEQSKEDRKSKKSSKRNKSEEEEEANNEDHKSKKKKSKSNPNVDQVQTEKKEEHKQKKTPGNNDDDAAEKKQKRATPKEELDAIDDAETSFAEIFARDNVSKGSGVESEKKRSSVQETGLVRVIDTQDNKKKQKKTVKNQSKSVVVELPMEVEIGLGGESKWE